MSDMPETIYIDPHSPELDWCYAPLDEMFIEYVRADKYAELEEQLKSARNDGFDMCKADYREQFAEYDEHIAELEERIALYQKWRDTADKAYDKLEAQNKRLVGLLKEVRLTKDYQWLYSEYGEFEWIGDRDEVLASMEPRKLTGYESEALNNALTASSTLVGRGMEKDDE